MNTSMVSFQASSRVTSSRDVTVTTANIPVFSQSRQWRHSPSQLAVRTSRDRHGAPPKGGAVSRLLRPSRLPKSERKKIALEFLPDPNFTATRSLFCAILEQAVDDWRILQRADRIPPRATHITVAHIFHGKRGDVRMSKKDVASLLELLTTSALDRFCAHMIAIVKPEGIRRALGIPEPMEARDHEQTK
ncbi:MAG: hypothetical protein NTY53_21620 [Kiritimatiellaeota bacterium]|nr:hypothetical protein [Kiritimatiellota bacterium]